jgi:hypothetical protein
MPVADSISAADRDLMRRLTVVLLVIVFLTAVISRVHSLYGSKFYDVTGEAQWIWPAGRSLAGEPLAFFATRDFTLPENRLYAHLKILGDPEYTLWVNGRQAASRRVGHSGSTVADERRLALYDISELVRDGPNRIVVAVRAPQGVGGLLAALDLEPERQNWLVTDSSWKLYQRWTEELLLRDPADGGGELPAIIGEPPVGRWNYPQLERAPVRTKQAEVLEPAASFPVDASIPEIRTVGGVTVALGKLVRGRAFDFGFTRGQVRLRIAGRTHGSRAIQIRLANDRGELALTDSNLRTVVVAPGEVTVTIPETHSFRYVMVIGAGATAVVVPEPPNAQ